MPTLRRKHLRRYKRPNNKGIINKNTTPKEYKVKNFIDCQWIQGGTLKRYMLQGQKSTKDRKVFYVRTPCHRDVIQKCDGCIRIHQPMNYECSFTRGLKETFAEKAGEFYDFNTRESVKEKWAMVSQRNFKTCKISEEIYELVL